MFKTFKLSMLRYCMAVLIAVTVSGMLSPAANAQEQARGGYLGYNYR